MYFFHQLVNKHDGFLLLSIWSRGQEFSAAMPPLPLSAPPREVGGEPAYIRQGARILAKLSFTSFPVKTA